MYSHGHSCYYYCRLCLPHDHVFISWKIIRCPSCSLLCSSGECLQRGTKLWLLKKTIDCLAMFFCEKCNVYVEKQHECKSWKCQIYYTQICNVNQHQCFMPTIKNPGEGQGCIIYDTECMQETSTRTQTMFLPWSYHQVPLGMKNKGQKGNLKENGSLKGTHFMDFIHFFMDTKF